MPTAPSSFVINLNKTTTISDIDKLRDKLNEIGDSVIVVGDLELVKVHVHTNNPDKALGYALTLGELDKPKIENMLQQSREFKKELERVSLKEQAIVAVCTGEGIDSIFRELGAEEQLCGGQTMNPERRRHRKYRGQHWREECFCASQQQQHYSGRRAGEGAYKGKYCCYSYKNIPQGIAAAINFNPRQASRKTQGLCKRQPKMCARGR